jgi:hypothetical protein
MRAQDRELLEMMDAATRSRAAERSRQCSGGQGSGKMSGMGSNKALRAAPVSASAAATEALEA